MPFLLLFIVMPILEIAVLLKVGGAIGVLPTLGIVVLTAVIGTRMLRQQGTATLERARSRFGSGEMPADEMIEGLLLLVGGVLLLTPGFVTDAFGFACLIPASRRWLATRLSARAIGVVVGGGRFGGPPGGGPASGADPLGGAFGASGRGGAGRSRISPRAGRRGRGGARRCGRRGAPARRATTPSRATTAASIERSLPSVTPGPGRRTGRASSHRWNGRRYPPRPRPIDLSVRQRGSDPHRGVDFGRIVRMIGTRSGRVLTRLFSLANLNP